MAKKKAPKCWAERQEEEIHIRFQWLDEQYEHARAQLRSLGNQLHIANCDRIHLHETWDALESAARKYTRISDIAVELGVSPTTVRRRFKKYGITWPKRKE